MGSSKGSHWGRVLLMALTLAAMLLPVVAVAAPQADTRGRKTVYEEHGDIYVRGTDGTRQLTSDGKSHEPVWSPDGTWIAFVSERDSKPDVYSTDIYLMRPDGTGVTPVTKDAREERLPAFSRAGDLYFTRRAERNDNISNLVVKYVISSAEESVLYEQPGGLCGPTNLSISPEGNPALSLNCGRGKFVFLIDAITGEAKSLSDLGIAGLVGCEVVGVWAHNKPLLAVIVQPECQGDENQYGVVLDFSVEPPSMSRVNSPTRVTSVSWSEGDELLVNEVAHGSVVPGMPQTGEVGLAYVQAGVACALLAIALGLYFTDYTRGSKRDRL